MGETGKVMDLSIPLHKMKQSHSGSGGNAGPGDSGQKWFASAGDEYFAKPGDEYFFKEMGGSSSGNSTLNSTSGGSILGNAKAILQSNNTMSRANSSSSVTTQKNLS